MLRSSMLAPRPRARRVLGWASLVLALLGVQLALLVQRFYYGNDDLLQFAVARREGLSWELLSLNVFQHFAPYNRLAHLAVAASDLSPTVGLAFMAVNYVLLLTSCLWFMSELGLSGTRKLLALVAIGLSVTVAESAVWFDTSMHILPAIAVTMAVCAAHVRGVRTGARRWHLLAILLLVLGQLTQERPVFAVPLAVLTDVFLLWRHLPWADRLRRLWTVRWPIIGLAATAAVIVGLLWGFVRLEDASTPDWETTGRTMLLGLTAYVVPSLVNQPIEAGLSLSGQLGVLVLVILVSCFLGVLHRGNAGPLVFAGCAFLLYYGFLKMSPLLVATPRSIVANAERLHYAVYVVVPVVIALAHIRVRGRRRWLSDGRWRPMAVASVVAVAAGYLATSANGYLDRRWAATTEARSYLDAVRAEAPEWSDPGASLLPLWAPPAMATSWAGPLARHDRLLPLIAEDFRVGDLGSRPVIIDGDGAVREVLLDDAADSLRVDSGTCSERGVPTGSHIVVRGTLRRTAEPLFLVVTYRAREDVEIRAVADPDRPGNAARYSTTILPGGSHTRILPIETRHFGELDIFTVGGVPVCLEEIRLVRALLRTDDRRLCHEIDRYGRPGAAVRCR